MIPRIGMLLVLIAAVPAARGSGFETIANLETPPGNLTMTPSGRIILSLHQFYEPEIRVAEVGDDGTLVPFPNAAWNDPRRPDSRRLDSVLGIGCDTTGTVWMLDNGLRGGVEPKLVGWSARHDSLVSWIPLPPPITRENSFVNDLAIDSARRIAYVADPAGGDNAALIVVDLVNGAARRVLEGTPFVRPEDLDLVIDGEPLERHGTDGDPVRPRIGVNPIALDPFGYWLYFGPMHGRSLYRVRTADLLDDRLEPAELAENVVRYAEKPICDGIGMDRASRIYLGDLPRHAIGRIDRRGEYRILFQDPILAWVDAFSLGPDGMIYAAVNQLHLSPPFQAGEDRSRAPYPIIRFDPRSAGTDAPAPEGGGAHDRR